MRKNEGVRIEYGDLSHSVTLSKHYAHKGTSVDNFPTLVRLETWLKTQKQVSKKSTYKVCEF